MSVIDTSKVIRGNKITATGILFFVRIFQNIGNRVLFLSKAVFSWQKLSNEHTMSSVRQFRNFDPIKGIADPLGAGGTGPKLHISSIATNSNQC